MTMLLGIDTSTSRCSVAIGDGGFVEEIANDTPREHHALILPMVAELLERCHIALRQLDAIAFGRGPGSFTGLRIAASITQGLAFGADRPVIAVSSHAALAVAALESARDARHTHVLVATDAHMGEIYWGHFRLDEQGVAAVSEDQLASAADWQPATMFDPATTLFAGDAWALYSQLLPAGVHCASDIRPGAAQVVRIAARAPASSWLKPEQAEPVYVRSASVWKKTGEQ